MWNDSGIRCCCAFLVLFVSALFCGRCVGRQASVEKHGRCSLVKGTLSDLIPSAVDCPFRCARSVGYDSDVVWIVLVCALMTECCCYYVATKGAIFPYTNIVHMTGPMQRSQIEVINQSDHRTNGLGRVTHKNKGPPATQAASPFSVLCSAECLGLWAARVSFLLPV
jgi:hypothetical protein